MLLLTVKLVLTPALVIGTTLAGRRFGGAVSGWIVGLPLMSGPLTAFFAVEHGKGFAARASVGSLSGTLGQTAFCVGWALTAHRGSWRFSLTAASCSFAVVGLIAELLPLDEGLPLPLLALAGATVLALPIGLKLLPPMRFEAVESVLPARWDLAGRTIVATGLLLLLTAVAETLGARLAGLAAVYPLYTAALAGFAQRNGGPAAATQILHGLLLGLFAFVTFYCALAALLPRTSLVISFALAIVLALVVHGITLLPLQRAQLRY